MRAPQSNSSASWRSVIYPDTNSKSAEPELRNALQSLDPDVVSAAIDAVERFKTGQSQVALLNVALKGIQDRPITVRRKAADAVIRHVRGMVKESHPTASRS